GFSSVIFTIFNYIGFTVAALCLFELKDFRNLTDNLVYNFAVASGLGRTGGLFASFAVVLSSIAALETTMLQFSRTLFAMGRDGAMPRNFGVVSPKGQTPNRAMYVLIAIGLVLIWLSSLMPTVNGIISASINALAIQVTYYYGLAGLVAAYEFRNVRGVGRWTLLCLFPALSAIMLLGLGIYAITTFNFVTKVVGLGGFAIGIFFFRLHGYPERPEILPAAAE